MPSIFRPGSNAWHVVPASRLAVLIDAQAYYDAFISAVLQARKSVYVLGWDVQGNAELRPDGPMPEGLPRTLSAFLDAVVRRRRGLRVRVLDWDFSLVFARERELLPELRFGWLTHRRLEFRLDGEHPLGASHHQKIVVVDDAVAFLGGLDLTVCRWDTPEHRVEDPRRRWPDGTPYTPFHDVQVAVSGQAAAALGELARQRWHRATGQRLRPPPPTRHDPWPADLAPDVTDVPVALARTLPAYEGPEVREVERLFLDSIAAARRHIYVENQYFTSTVVRDALAARLEEPEGPEIVLVVPQTCSGWLEESTMGVLRSRVLGVLRKADHSGRLRVYYPRLPGGEVRLNVHSKVMIVDDTLLRIGSANLSNRSMGLDTECDLALEAGDDPRVPAAIAGVRARLLGEHLGVPAERVASATLETGSLIAAVERLGGNDRTLAPLDDASSESVGAALADAAIIDLERPLSDAPFLRGFLPPPLREPALRGTGRALLTVGLLLVLALVWHWTGLGRWTRAEEIAQWVAPVRSSLLAPLWVVAAFVMGGFLMAPVTALIVATVWVFTPWPGILYALGGALCSAIAGYAAGRLLWRDTLRRLVGRYMHRVQHRLDASGPLTIAAVRLLPVAPFTVVNLVAGGLRVRLDHYVLGTLLGMAPGALALGWLAGALWP